MSESLARNHHFHSDDPDEVSAFIERIYADNRFRARRAEKRDVSMSGQEWNGIGIYDVDYEMPFHFRSDEARPNYLFLSCTRGGSTYSSAGLVAQCTVGDVIPISSMGNSECHTRPEGFGHLSVILDAVDLNEFVTRWIGRPLVEPIQFDLKPLSAEVATQWNVGAVCLRRMMLMAPLPDIAVHALYEHMLKLVAMRHCNNYSENIINDQYAAEHVVRSAIAMIELDPTNWKTLGAIAHALGCPASALENGIRRLTGNHSEMIFMEARLRGVHRALAAGDGRSFVGTLRAFGFSPSSRFIREYRQRFGERPSATYRRNPNSVDSGRDIGELLDPLCENSINQFIDESLGKPIGLADLARQIGLSEYATIAAFKEQFSRTPMQYVIERRLERARWLLCNTSLSILSIAIECGFGTQSYLTTQIKRYYGITPRQLRLSVVNSADDV